MSLINQNRKQKLDIKIRDFEKKDYEDIANINNSIYPDRPLSAEEFIEFDNNRPKKCKHHRWVAIVDDKLVGTALYTQEIWQYHPNKFHCYIMVRPEYQNQGIGLKLFDLIYESIQQFDPIQINTEARDDMKSSIRFLETRGFKYIQRYAEPHLEVDSFDFAPYESLEKRLNSEGILIKTMRELENDPNRNRKIYEMDQEIAPDMPDEEGFTKLDYETFRKENLEASYTLPDAYFIALEGDTYVGLSVLMKFKKDKNLYTGLTGVRRPYRGRGIATYLKVKAIGYAKQHNYTKIGTDNNSINEPMRHINNKLGFKKVYDWMCYKKVFKNESITEK